jgi:uncharacterized membrane protein HdeD (DUF308 family)
VDAGARGRDLGGVRPGALALIFWIAAFAIVHGVLLTMVAFRVRRLAREGIARPA